MAINKLVNHTGCGNGRKRVGKVKPGRGQMAGRVPLHLWCAEKTSLRQEREWLCGHLGEQRSERDEGSEVGTLDLPGVSEEQEGGQWGWSSVRRGRRDTMTLTLALTPSGMGVAGGFSAEGWHELTYICKTTCYH